MGGVRAVVKVLLVAFFASAAVTLPTTDVKARSKRTSKKYRSKSKRSSKSRRRPRRSSRKPTPKPAPKPEPKPVVAPTPTPEPEKPEVKEEASTPEEKLKFEEPEKPARFYADIPANQPERAWIANAIKQYLYHELSGFTRMEPTEDVKRPQCPDNKTTCLLKSYGEQEIDIVLLGELNGDVFSYNVYETWTKSRVNRGTMTVGQGRDDARLRRDLFAMMNPVLAHGGILDQRDVLQAAVQENKNKVSAETASATQPRQIFLGALLGLFTLILLFGAQVGARKEPHLRPTLRVASWVWLLLLVVSIPIVLPDIQAWLLLPSWPAVALRYKPVLLSLAGGILWGTLVLLLSRLAFPPIMGIVRVREENLGSIISAWLQSAFMRLVFLGMLIVPVVVGITFAIPWLQLDSHVAWTLGAPALGLLLCLWVVVIAEALSAWADRKLVSGDEQIRALWHSALRHYFRGYVKRLGVDVPRIAFDRIQFIPTDRTGIWVYGGGLAGERIAVDERILELALGSAPQEERVREEEISFEQWQRGRVVPSWGRKTSARAQKKARKRIERREKRLPKLSLFRTHRHRPAHLGQVESLLGYAMPRPGETTPLVATDADDFSVVRSILTDHYAAFEKHVFDETYDDTDPRQLDFLFGALLHAYGSIVRHETLWGTFRTAIALATDKLPKLIGRPVTWVRAVHREIVGRYPSVLSDAFCVLNFARDHLIQYLYYLHSRRENTLTARANPYELMAKSREILREILELFDADEKKPTLRPEPENRLLWLSEYFNRETPPMKRSILATAMITLCVGGMSYAIASEVLDAVKYRPVYKQRLIEQKEKAEEAAKKKQEKEAKEGASTPGAPQ